MPTIIVWGTRIRRLVAGSLEGLKRAKAREYLHATSPLRFERFLEVSRLLARSVIGGLFSMC